MNNKHQFFKIFTDCIPIKGLNSSLIYDLNKNCFYQMENSFLEVLNFADGKLINDIITKYSEEVMYFLNSLVENNIAFYTSSPEEFPSMTFEYSDPSIIINSILEIGNLTNFDILDTMKQLIDLNCKSITIIITSNDKVIDSYLSSIISVTDKSSIKNIDLILDYKYFNFCREKLLKQTSRIGRILFYNNLSAQVNEIVRDTKLLSTSLDEISYTEIINPQEFTTNPKLFSESLLYNIGLNRSVTIDKNGYIKNHITHKRTFGHINECNLSEIIGLSEFQKSWKISNDNIEGCKLCKFRYCCFSNSEIHFKNGKHIKNNDCEIYQL